MRNRGFGFGLRGFYENFNIRTAVHWHEMQQTTQFKFNSSNQVHGRDLIFRFDDFTFDIGAGVGSKMFELNALIGLLNRNIRVENWYIYADGTRSIRHSEFYTSGYFKGRLTDFLIGGSAAVYIVPNLVGVQAKVLYPVNFFKLFDLNTDANFALEDFNEGRNFYLTRLPRDYGLWIANMEAGIYDYEDNIIPSSFRGPTYMVTVFVNIPFFFSSIF